MRVVHVYEDEPVGTLPWAVKRMQERADQLNRGKRPGLSLGACFRDAEAIELLIEAASDPAPTEQGDLAKDLRGAADYLRDHGMAPYYESRVRRAADTLDAHTHSGTAGRVSEEDQARLRKLRDLWMELTARYRPDAEILTRVLAALDPTPDSEAEARASQGEGGSR